MQQLDLFRDTQVPAEPSLSDNAARPAAAPDTMATDELLAAFLMRGSWTVSLSPPKRGGGA